MKTNLRSRTTAAILFFGIGVVTTFVLVIAILPFAQTRSLNKIVIQQEIEQLNNTSAVRINEHVWYFPDTRVGYMTLFGPGRFAEIYADGIRAIVNQYPGVEVVDFEIHQGTNSIIVQFEDKK